MPWLRTVSSRVLLAQLIDAGSVSLLKYVLILPQEMTIRSIPGKHLIPSEEIFDLLPSLILPSEHFPFSCGMFSAFRVSSSVVVSETDYGEPPGSLIDVTHDHGAQHQSAFV